MAERGIIEQAYGQLIPQGMRPNYAAPRTSVEPTSMVGRGEIRPYNFSWRDMARQWLGSIGMSDNTANAVITLADFTPVGAAFVGNEARRAVGRGERLAPAAEVALAAAPLPMAAKRAASKVVREVAQEVPTITAYHGSPHTFDRFDMSKIGTGEGAQVYGHGLYFAENEDVARSYRDALSPKKVEVGGVALPENVQKRLANAINRFPTVDSYLNPLISSLEKRKLEAAQAVKDGDTFMSDILSADVNSLQSAVDALIPHRGKAFDQVPAGSMYQVQINANPEDFLDWDAPFGQQPKKVQDAIRYAFGPQPENAMIGGNTMDKPREMHTRLMQEKGIPGIKYLDQGSRGAGQGSRNFVVFDDKLINILKRYSWVPGMAIPAAAIQEYTTMYGVAPDLGGQPPSVTVY
jgi:hypothetical protein